MATQQTRLVRQHNSSLNAQKAELTYKLFLLEKARNTLKLELRNFMKKVYGEVHPVLNSPFPASAFHDLTEALDLKLQNLLKLSEMLKDPTVDSHIWPVCKNGKRSNNLQTCGPKRMKVNLMPVAIQFGPMVETPLVSSPTTKTVQVLVTSLSQPCIKLFWPQPALRLQESIEASASSSSCQSKEDKEAVFVEKSKWESVCVPPSAAQNHLIGEEKPQAPLPPLPALFSENSNPKPLVIRGQGNEFQQGKKLTARQLLKFFRAKAKNKDPPYFTTFGWTAGRNEAKNSETSQSISDNYTTQSNQLLTDRISARASITLSTNDDNPHPVLSPKRFNSSGNVIYSLVIMTETELWDDGEISDATNSTEKADHNPQNLHSRQPELEKSSANSQTPNSASLPDFENRRFEETEVVVSHIRSPSAFYIQHADSHEKLRALVKHSCEISPSYAEQNCIPAIGTLVMGRFCEKDQWFRAQVTKICGVSPDDVPIEGVGSKSVKVDVKRLDYGDTCCLSLWNVTALPAEVAALPLQALQVSLANVMPIDGMDWSEEAVGWFQTMTRNRTLYARLYPQKATVTVELFLEKEKKGVMRRGATLSVRLVQNGHARLTKLQYTDLVRKRAVEVKARK